MPDLTPNTFTGPTRAFALKPGTIDHVQAGALPLVSLTAWQALADTARLAAGQRVLVHAAAGGVGHVAVQIAKAMGAYVIGTASAGNHELLRSLGATSRSTTMRPTSPRRCAMSMSCWT